MTTILVIFVIAFSISLVLTPMARVFGIRFGAMDALDERKIHNRPMPRTGGMAIFLSFCLTLFLATTYKTNITQELVLDRKILWFFVGAVISFGIGLVDDFRSVNPWIKFFFQVLAATAAFMGGLTIRKIGFLDWGFVSEIIRYSATVFWFVLIINAVNLVDGMDGLAAGIVVFACVISLLFNLLRAEFLAALLFAALGGATLGFLRYNFNPASIFLGDGGSYFLGYAVASISIISGAKMEMGAVLLIPVLALGIPIFDTILAPIRRFLRGKKMFMPDRGHIHHRLRGMGLTTKKAVMVMYGLTTVLCVLAVMLVNYQDERIGLFLILLGVGAFFLIRKLGYLEYLARDKVFDWLRDVSDVAGFTHERRSFLNMQMDLAASKDFDSLWEKCITGFNMLGFDFAEMALESHGESFREKKPVCGGNGLVWCRNGFNQDKHLYEESLLKLELPLLNEKGVNLGTLWLVKNLKREPVSHYTLRRIEHLRRTLTKRLRELD